MTETRGGDQVWRGMKMKAMVAVDDSEAVSTPLSGPLIISLPPLLPWGRSHQILAPPGNEGLLFLVHVQPNLPVGPEAYTGPAVMDAVKKAREEISARVVSKALQMCKDKLVRAESVIMNGDPREVICEAAEKMQVDLLIMGSLGLGTFKRAILGKCERLLCTSCKDSSPHSETSHAASLQALIPSHHALVP